MSPLSRDPAKRARQLANLRSGPDAAGSWKPGDAPALQHGARSRRPEHSPEWSPVVWAAITDLQARVGAELKDQGGELHPWALPSVEAVALARLAAWRGERYVADREAKGLVNLEDLDRQSKVTERYHRALEREALTLSSRIEAAGSAHDLARLWAEQARA